MTRGDVLTPEQRRRCMSRNRGRDTAPEMALRRLCWALGLRYRLNSRLIGKPDFIFYREKIAVFVDGCFWHGCPIHYVAPATRGDFWKAKLEATRKRDAAVTANLRAAGWVVLRIWEHSLRTDALRLENAYEIRDAVHSRSAR